MKLKPAVWIGILVAALAAWLIASSTLRGPRYRVEACMYFNARYNCRTVSGRSEQAALRSAIQNACAEIASGVDEIMGCESSQPKSVKWLERPSSGGTPSP